MKSYLYLEDGTTIEGISAGALIDTEGEVVFSTGMTGYLQSLTDPSFAGQILVCTYPLIGNYGVPRSQVYLDDIAKNFESKKVWVRGVILGDLCLHESHSDSIESFSNWLTRKGIPILSQVDTRALTLHLREVGVMKGVIRQKKTRRFDWDKVDTTVNLSEVSTSTVKVYLPAIANGKTVAVIDCGVKHGILRALLQRGYTVHRVPWDMNPLDLNVPLDAVVVSNGPGDPKQALKTVFNIRQVLDKKIPYLGICLGHQLLALAIGADTYKLLYGHRGLNQPVQDAKTKRAYLTSQNHGYAVDSKTIPSGFEAWFTNLNDGTNEGIRNEKKKIWSVQFHPEGQPGPADTEWIFDLI